MYCLCEHHECGRDADGEGAGQDGEVGGAGCGGGGGGRDEREELCYGDADEGGEELAEDGVAGLGEGRLDGGEEEDGCCALRKGRGVLAEEYQPERKHVSREACSMPLPT